MSLFPFYIESHCPHLTTAALNCMVSRKARYDTSSCLNSSNGTCPVGPSRAVFHASQAALKALGNLSTLNVSLGLRTSSVVILFTMAVLNLSMSSTNDSSNSLECTTPISSRIISPKMLMTISFISTSLSLTSKSLISAIFVVCHQNDPRIRSVRSLYTRFRLIWIPCNLIGQRASRLDAVPRTWVEDDDDLWHPTPSNAPVIGGTMAPSH